MTFVLWLATIPSALLVHRPIVGKRLRACRPAMAVSRLPDALAEHSVDPELSSVLCAVAGSVAEISLRLATLPITGTGDVGGELNVQGEQQEGMDVEWPP